MSNQIILISIFNKRENIKYRNLIKDNILSEETKEILKYIGLFYENSPVIDSISDWESFGDWFLIKHPMFKSEQSAVYREIFSQLDALDPTKVPEREQILSSFITRNVMAQVADNAMRVAEGETDDVEAVLVSVEQLARELGQIDNVDQYLVDDDIDTLIQSVVAGGGYNWRLHELNVALGPLRVGNFINFIARPDSGKTTMLASEATHIASQLPEGKHVIWFNNEEEGKKVKLRCVQAATGKKLQEILANPGQAWVNYQMEIGSEDRIKFYSRPTFSVRDVEEVLNKYDAGLIIFDQLRKVKGFDKESANDVGRMELLFQQAREWAKEYGPVLNVHQAGGTAEGKQYIEMHEIYGSQTSIQGESDAIVTIGRMHEPGYEYSRFLYVPKNKMSGGPPPFDEAQRNGKFEIKINPTIARFE